MRNSNLTTAVIAGIAGLAGLTNSQTFIDYGRCGSHDGYSMEGKHRCQTSRAAIPCKVAARRKSNKAARKARAKNRRG